MLVDEFRPREFKDVIGLNQSIISYVNKNDIPHLLFYGSAGTGKTTTAHIIKEKLATDCLTLNASNERGIEVIRDKIKTFASTVSSKGKVKLVFLDEADALTNDAQNALRNTMETYHSNCRFILTCNYINKITEPIKSRCQKFQFQLPKKEEISGRLYHIIEVKNILIENKAVDKIVEITYPDIRSAINKLESLSFEHDDIKFEHVIKEELEINKLFELIRTKGVNEIRQWVLDSNIDYKQTLISLNDYVWKNRSSINNIIKVIFEIAETGSKLNSVVCQEMEFTKLLIKIKLLIKNA